MIVAPDQPKVIALLDWELSTLGDPLADFSYHTLTWHLKPEEFRGMAGADLATLGIPSERDHLALYCERSAVRRSRRRSGTSISSTTCSGSRRSCKDREAESRTAPLRAQPPAKPAPARPIAELAWRWAQDRLDAR
jgi:hypothetical protein